MVRPGREAIFDPEPLGEKIGVRVGLHDPPRTPGAGAGERGDDRPRRRVIAAEDEGFHVGVEREDQIEGALRDRQR